ncbi:MAG: hypothetical protein HRT58_12140 [Crocinitomicaceae bacterium]|nr:hypothetical protein [Flavobacteriales bacterium]NQZ36411.1 hypothetical protein [Crocinitomicaceae bacterium]
MDKLKAYIFFVGVLLVVSSCQNQDSYGQLDPDSVIISSVKIDSISTNLMEQIVATEGFKNWQFNQFNADTTSVIGYYRTQILEIKIKDSTYYQVDLRARVSQSLLSSTISPTIEVCQFRLSNTGRNQKILNKESGKFIALDSEEGTSYLRQALSNRE